MVLNKKKIKKEDSAAKERYFGVILENIDSKVDLLVEEHGNLNNKIDRIHKDLDEKIERVDNKVGVLSNKVGVLDKKIDKVDTKVESLRNEMNYKFETVFDELHLIRNDLKEKVGRDEFIILEKRVSFLEKKFVQ